MPPAKKPEDETGKPAAKKPAAKKPAASKAAASKPAAKKPAAKKPAEKKPAAASAEAPAGGSGNERFGLHSLSPAPGSRRPRKRVGRGEGSGLGKTAGRGQKGYGSRSGAKDRTRFEGGQMPIQKRMRKLRGPNMKKSMPFERFRTHTQAVNIGDLDARFDSGAEVTIEALGAKGLGSRPGVPVKVLAKGEISKPLTVQAHGFSASAREAIEAAGGTCVTVEP
jgi:large subunit ribosomal protein L15